MFINNNWEFLLRGSPQDLWSLSCTTGSSYFQIYEVTDFWNECSVDDYRFRSIYCNNENDCQIVWQIGYELVSLFNGASSLFDSNCWKIEIEQLWNNDLKQNYYENLDCFILDKPDISEEAVATELQKAKSDIRLMLLNKATEDEGIYLVLKYFNMEKNWVTYYKILESIEYLTKEEDITLSIDPKAREKFTNVANNYSLSGIHSRHGLKKNLKKNRTPAMSLNEAHDFIRDVAQQYIKAKI